MIEVYKTQKGEIRFEIKEESGDNAVEYLSTKDAADFLKEVLDAIMRVM